MIPRLCWSSELAERVWAPRIEAVHEAWQEVEWLSVVAGLRQCAIVHVDPEELPRLAGRLARSGVMVVPIDRQAAGVGGFRHRLQPAKIEEVYRYRAIVGRPDAILRFQDSLESRDDAAVGALLGYPPCCTEAFSKRWQREKSTDPIWQMAKEATGAREAGDCIELIASTAANVVCRYLGVRLVPHLPCSMSCEATIRLSASFLEVASAAGMYSEMTWASTVLEWPCEWSSAHGIAEVKLPILKCVNSTDVVAGRRVVRLIGRSYPEEGALGLVFPFRPPLRPGLTERAAFRSGAEQL